jgi:hypothetical protein
MDDRDRSRVVIVTRGPGFIRCNFVRHQPATALGVWVVINASLIYPGTHQAKGFVRPAHYPTQDMSLMSCDGAERSSWQSHYAPAERAFGDDQSGQEVRPELDQGHWNIGRMLGGLRSSKKGEGCRSVAWRAGP